MADDETDPADKARYRKVPSGRASRLGAFGKLAGGVAGGLLGEGARRLARGERPKMRDLLLTPGNARRLTDQLSHLRGAAMKMGQMISMDAGDMLPPELSEILSALRSQAHRMPPPQLRDVLDGEWGKGWRDRFKSFNATPIAAASIGQVHRAVLPDGREVAIKVQYPGVRESIDSDVDNVTSLLRISGLVPKELDLTPLLDEAKRQLHEEADYLREAEQMDLYADRLEGDDRYVVPRSIAELTTPRVLVMDFVEARPIETLDDEPQEIRDRAMAELIALLLRELFEFGVMQTDPNFANYRYQPDSGKLVLLDFGATRDIAPAIAESYRRLFAAGLAKDRDAVRAAAVDAGFVGPGVLANHREALDDMIDIVIAEMTREGPFDFGDRAFVQVLREQGMDMATDRATWHLPPAETIFVQRKISGTALLAARFKARVDIRGLARPYLDKDPRIA
ncbi:ABC1 kinase family protein [Pseudoblastomonas halimionae]|uniref:AarF/ABC1/UbiB kinase family protein n=1 Tax=Alteriqipengyuania halimionae TaxID=1926630 RepID=A0A6I4U4B9_9SPHN|nr:AarF/ABC1/UbiB kinase family protein [Alteriqipengyuania halimionae]MXP10204.1 AarF/ABC1/UbiB kinase family protein [Alteriqipengyuania halimionae]